MTGADRSRPISARRARDASSERAAGERSSSGARVTSTYSSFQNSRLAGEYGLGSNGRSRKAASSGKVATMLPPNPATQ